jgi:Glycoside-hydrolase family GH114
VKRFAALAILTAMVPLAAPGTGLAGARHPLPPPVATGTLAVHGQLRDGGTALAAGLAWRPGRLPHGDRLLSFEVAYTWESCAAGACRPGAGTTSTPFAARRYVAGHADAGRRLRLTETASEVVETDPATFAFSVVRASRTVLSTGAVRTYPAGRAPWSGFVDGTPERRTGSDSEIFAVSAPHYAAAAGAPAVTYRVDGRPWTAVPGSRLIHTGTLPLGRHRVSVRTADAAGATVRSFRWRVVPLPAPAACRPRHGRACWYPPHLDRTGRPMRWDWQIGRVTPLERTGANAVDIYDIDGFLTTPAEIRAIRTGWPAATLAHPRTVCYLDLAWEDYRPDGSTPARGGRFPADTLGNVYYGYPQERWLDFRRLDALKPMLRARLAMCAAKGFDAVELDDIDSFDPPGETGFHLTPGDAQNFLAYALNQTHRDGMTALWKNSPLLSWWGRRYSDGAVVEECYAFAPCFSAGAAGSTQYGFTCTALAGPRPCGWDDFTTDVTPRQPTGKWVGEVEYAEDHYVCAPGAACTGPHRFSAYCRAIESPPYGFSAMRLDVDLDGRLFQTCS